MSIINKIVKNSGVILLGYILETLVNLVISVLLAKYFGQMGFGKLSFLAAFFFFLAAADNQWIRPILVREMARNRDNSGAIVGNGLIIRSLVALTAIIMFWIVILVVNPSIDVKILAFFTSITLLLTPVLSSYETIFQVSLRMEYFVGLNLLSKLLILVVIFIVVILDKGLIYFYVLAFIPNFVLLFLLRQYSREIIKPNFRIDKALWRMIFKESWPLALTAIFIFVYHRLDHFMLMRISGSGAVGIYSAGIKLVEVFNTVPLALMAPVLPLISEYFIVSKDKFHKVYQLSFKYLLIFIIPIAMLVTVFSDSIVYFIYGKDFLSCSLALSILIWSEVFVFVGVVNNSILIASNKQILDPLFTGISALVNILLNLILIAKYSFTGAAISALVSCATGPIMGYFIKTTHEYSLCMIKYAVKPILSSFLIILLIYCFHWNFLWSVILSPGLYVLIMYFIKGVNNEDIRKIKELSLKKIVYV